VPPELTAHGRATEQQAPRQPDQPLKLAESSRRFVSGAPRSGVDIRPPDDRGLGRFCSPRPSIYLKELLDAAAGDLFRQGSCCLRIDAGRQVACRPKWPAVVPDTG